MQSKIHTASTLQLEHLPPKMTDSDDSIDNASMDSYDKQDAISLALPQVNQMTKTAKRNPDALQNLKAYHTYLNQDPSCNARVLQHVLTQIELLEQA